MSTLTTSPEAMTSRHAMLTDEIGNEVYASHYAERKAYRLIIACGTVLLLGSMGLNLSLARRPIANRYIRIDEMGRAQAIQYMYSPGYPALKTALNGITLAMMIEMEETGIKVNLVSPGFTKTNLNGYAGLESLEDGSREVVRVALLGPDGPTGTFTHWENAAIPW